VVPTAEPTPEPTVEPTAEPTPEPIVIERISKGYAFVSSNAVVYKDDACEEEMGRFLSDAVVYVVSREETDDEAKDVLTICFVSNNEVFEGYIRAGKVAFMTEDEATILLANLVVVDVYGNSMPETAFEKAVVVTLEPTVEPTAEPTPEPIVEQNEVPVASAAQSSPLVIAQPTLYFNEETKQGTATIDAYGGIGFNHYYFRVYDQYYNVIAEELDTSNSTFIFDVPYSSSYAVWAAVSDTLDWVEGWSNWITFGDPVAAPLTIAQPTLTEYGEGQAIATVEATGGNGNYYYYFRVYDQYYNVIEEKLETTDSEFIFDIPYTSSYAVWAAVSDTLDWKEGWSNFTPFSSQNTSTLSVEKPNVVVYADGNVSVVVSANGGTGNYTYRIILVNSLGGWARIYNGTVPHTLFGIPMDETYTVWATVSDGVSSAEAWSDPIWMEAPEIGFTYLEMKEQDGGLYASALGCGGGRQESGQPVYTYEFHLYDDKYSYLADPIVANASGNAYFDIDFDSSMYYQLCCVVSDGIGQALAGWVVIEPSNFTYEVIDNTYAQITGYTGPANADLVIPDELGGYPVKAIGADAFRSYGITGTLQIPSAVETIGDYAFYGNTFSGQLILPSALKTLGAYSFCGCSGFTGDLNIPSGVSVVSVAAFKNCSGFNGVLSFGTPQ